MIASDCTCCISKYFSSCTSLTSGRTGEDRGCRLSILQSFLPYPLTPPTRYLLDRYYEALNPYIHHLGSRANLDLEHTPAIDRTLRVVNDWAKYSIYTSDPHKFWNFMTTFSHAVALNFGQEGDQAIGYIWKTRTMRREPPVDLIQQSGDRRYNVMYSLVDFMRGREASSLQSGIMFIK